MTKRQAIEATASTTTTTTTTTNASIDDDTTTDHNSNSENHRKRNRKHDDLFTLITAAALIENDDMIVVTENHEPAALVPSSSLSSETSFADPLVEPESLIDPFVVVTATTSEALPPPPEESSVVSLFHTIDLLRHIASFIGPNQFRYVAGINRGFRTAYTELFPIRTTSYCNISTTVSQAKMCFEEFIDEQFSRTRATCQRSVILCNSAAGNGNLPVLQYFRSMKCAWGERTCAYAAASGNLNVLQWVRQEGCRWNELTCEYAAKHGHLHVLQWAREKDCPWDHTTCMYAVAYNHLDIFEWACYNDCPIRRQSILDIADAAGNRNICERILSDTGRDYESEVFDFNYIFDTDMIFDYDRTPELLHDVDDIFPFVSLE